MLGGDGIDSQAEGVRQRERHADAGFHLPVLAHIGGEIGLEFVTWGLGHVVDRSAEGHPAIQGTLRPLDDFNALDVHDLEVHQHAAAGGQHRFRGDVDAVHQDSHRRASAVGRQAADMRAGVLRDPTFIEHQAWRQPGDVINIPDAGRLDELLVVHRDA